jgi:hypothetical protein
MFEQGKAIQATMAVLEHKRSIERKQHDQERTPNDAINTTNQTRNHC